MNKLFATLQVFFALSIIGFGIQHIVTGDFVTGRALPLTRSYFSIVWAVISGAGLIATGLMLVTGKITRRVILIDAAIIFIWAFLRHLLVLVMHPAYDAFLTNTGKSLAVTGAFLIIAGSVKANAKDRIHTSFRNEMITITGVYFIGLFLVICGIQHYIFIEFVSQLVPLWIPAPLFWTYFAGTALVFGGLGMMIKETRSIAAGLSGLMIFLWMLLLHFPRVITQPTDMNEMTSLLETLCLSSVLFMFPASYFIQKRDTASRISAAF